MAATDPRDDGELAAGDFSSWLVDVRAAIRGEGESEVPCAGCTACCTSSQFVHIGPEETDTLAHIPGALLFPAPRMPHGHVLLGYDEQGHCPMLIEGKCSIYAHRPRTCRTYDCRVFPAAGVEDPDEEKQQITARTRRWRFSHPAPVDRQQHDAVREAARFLEQHSGLFPDDLAPVTATQVAVLALEIHDLFLGAGTPDPDAVRQEVIRRKRAGYSPSDGGRG